MDAEQLHAAEKQEGKAAPSSAVAKSSNCCNYPHESHRFILKVRICSPDVLLMACAHTKPFFPSLSPCRFGAVLYRTAKSPLACHLALFILQHCTSQDMNCRTAFCLWWPASSLSFSVLALCLD